MRRDFLLAILRQKRTFAGMKMPFVFLVVLLVILVASSVVEQVAGTAAALTWGYTAPWTLGLWGLTAVSGGVAVWRSRRHTAVATRCLHGALLVILAGALATHLGGEDGELSLARKSAPTDRYLTDGRHVRHLPFSVRAIDFGTVRRADGAGAADYFTLLEVHHGDGCRDTLRIAMNRIGHVGTWRLYQTALSPAVTTLTLRHDPVGTTLTYAGYLLLGLSMAAFFFSRRTMWRRHWQALSGSVAAARRPLTVLLLAVLPLLSAAGTPTAAAIEETATAAAIAEEVQPQGAERLYHSVRPRPWVGGVMAVAGMVLTAVALRRGMRRRQTATWRRVTATMLGASAAYVGLTLSLRGYVAGYFPMSNGYETQQAMALLCLLAPRAVWRRVPLLAPLGMVAGGLALLVSALAHGQAGIGTLPPVLSSPLLSVHVTLVMCAYALLALIVCCAAIALTSRRQGAYLAHVEMVLLLPALFLLAAGILTGALWADISWGRYWGWDPKEVWALVTLLVYALPLHGRQLPAFRRPLFLHAYLLAAFVAVLMTWAGVNLLMGGLHSYA